MPSKSITSKKTLTSNKVLTTVPKDNTAVGIESTQTSGTSSRVITVDSGDKLKDPSRTPLRIVSIDVPFDKDPQSFFEIERIILTRAEVPTIERLGKKFNEAGGTFRGVEYAQPFENLGSHVLKAVVSLSFTEDIEITEVSIKMHNFGETNYAYVRNVRLSDGKTEIPIPEFIPTSVGKDVLTDDALYTTNPARNRYSLERRWVFPKRRVKKVIFELEQSNPYPLRYTLAAFTTIGANSDPYSNIGVFTDVSAKEVFQRIVWENINVVTLDSSQELSSRVAGIIPSLIDFPLFSPASTATPEKLNQSDPNQKFSLNKDIGEEGIITISREETNRWRYAIGISEIGIGRKKYSSTSEFVSKSFDIPYVSSVSLLVDDLVPPEFPEGDWLKYYVSFNDGTSWNRICPINRPSVYFEDGLLIPKIITVNSDAPDVVKKNNSSGQAAYYDTDDAIRSIKLKIELSKPVGDYFLNITPQVFYYRLKVNQ